MGWFYFSISVVYDLKYVSYNFKLVPFFVHFITIESLAKIRRYAISSNTWPAT